ncbi:hypothetical protein BGX27_005410 [Mortierella sp. AM989]|nr:hypothetical protein BGX27_005410 [Mortierella sp. AM989]
MIVRNAWNWTKIKPDPKNPFFSHRSTRNTPQTAIILLRNADIPRLQIKPSVFLPATGEQVQHALNILLFMSDFNTEPSPLAFNVLACSSTGLIHYIQIANQFFSLILPTYKITNCGRNPELIPPLLKTFLESSSYIKVGYGAYEDMRRVKDQYGIACKNVQDIYWMAKVMGIGSTNVGMLHDVFGEIHDVYIPGRIDSDGHVAKQGRQDGQLIDPRRWDWESHGSIELSRELVRCIAQDAFATLDMYNNILIQKFRHGYLPPMANSSDMVIRARDFLLTNLPRGSMLPVRSIHHLLKRPFMDSTLSNIDRDAQALALVKLMIDNNELVTERADTALITFQDPSVLSRCVALPGVRSSEALLANQYTKRIVTGLFGCRVDELRLMQDSDLARKPDKIQDLECFLGVYEWLEFLPGAELDEPSDSISRIGCGRKEVTLLTMFMNFGTVAERARKQPSETKQWASQRIQRLVQQGVLLQTGGPQGLIRVNPILLRRIKKIEQKIDNRQFAENKAISAR